MLGAGKVKICNMESNKQACSVSRYFLCPILYDGIWLDKKFKMIFFNRWDKKFKMSISIKY